MRVNLKKWGNSTAVRIPSAILAATELRLDETVDIREENGCIILEPIHEHRYTLNDMLAAITPDNQHAEYDFGKPVGKEAW